MEWINIGIWGAGRLGKKLPFASRMPFGSGPDSRLHTLLPLLLRSLPFMILGIQFPCIWNAGAPSCFLSLFIALYMPEPSQGVLNCGLCWYKSHWREEWELKSAACRKQFPQSWDPVAGSSWDITCPPVCICVLFLCTRMHAHHRGFCCLWRGTRTDYRWLAISASQFFKKGSMLYCLFC